MDEVKQILVVNTDLKMTVGKIAAQVAHASVASTLDSLLDERTLEWLQGSHTKVILKASRSEMDRLLSRLMDSEPPITWHAVYDEGRTEITEGSLTTLGLQPLRQSDIDKFKETNLLRLL